jgi:dTDP-glucose pyrophosphorylase
MAGEGNRFKNAGWTTPKPLIMLHGKPLFLHAIDSVKMKDVKIKYSFIIRQEHINEYQLDEKIKAILPGSNVFAVAKTTRGAVETCLVAESSIRDDDAVIVMDCDLEFRSKVFNEGIRRILELPADKANGGMLVSFDSDNPRYSYAEVDEQYRVIRTAEKQVISHHALCGAYFFSTGRGFLRAAHYLLDESNFDKPEYYVSLLYNYLLRNGEIVKLAPMEEYMSYGTPEELKRYL